MKQCALKVELAATKGTVAVSTGAFVSSQYDSKYPMVCTEFNSENEARRCKYGARCCKQYCATMFTISNIGIVILPGTVLCCDLVRLTQKIKRSALNMQRAATQILYALYGAIF